jgi:hypothetical protein
VGVTDQVLTQLSLVDNVISITSSSDDEVEDESESSCSADGIGTHSRSHPTGDIDHSRWHPVISPVNSRLPQPDRKLRRRPMIIP